jgi:hypothetical protein
MPVNKWGRRYPWERWFAQQRFAIARGTDYAGRTDTMIQQIRNKAGRFGIGIRIDVTDDNNAIVVTIIRRPAPVVNTSKGGNGHSKRYGEASKMRKIGRRTSTTTGGCYASNGV